MITRILYISGSIGLGHVMRDLAIAAEMRRMCPGVEIEWLAGPPASDVLVAEGEKLAPRQPEYRCDTELAEAVSHNGRLSLTTYVFRALLAWVHNTRVIKQSALEGEFDVIAGNETYEILVTNQLGIHRLPSIPFVMMYDFLGMEVTSRNVLERLGAWIINVLWANAWRVTSRRQNTALFFGELEDIPDRAFGFLLANRRVYADKYLEILGYPMPFDLAAVPSRDALRHELGYSSDPLVICTIGGTSVGHELLELCGRTYPLLVERIPGLQMVIVAGPRIDPASLDLPEGIDRRGMVPKLWRHLAACDLAIVQGGGATTLELEALRVPFLFFPLKNQAEQEVTIANRLARHGAGVRMDLASTSHEELAGIIAANIGVGVSYPNIPVEGCRLAAARILEHAEMRNSAHV